LSVWKPRHDKARRCERTLPQARHTQRNGTPIFLRDLGRLKLSNLERHGIVGKNHQNDVVEGTVLLLKDDNPSKVLEGIHAKVTELNERLADDDVQIVPYYDRSDLVDQTVSKVSTRSSRASVSF